MGHVVTDALMLAVSVGTVGFLLILSAIALDWTDSRTTEYERFLREWNKKP